MPLHSSYSKAVRLNGYTDGMVVPTGAHRESGIDLFRSAHPEKVGGANLVSSYESDEPKIGRLHIPNEGNPLNNMIGPFTLEAFIIPDMGGVVLHKPNCYTLKVGDVRSRGAAVFDVHTLDPSGEIGSQRVISTVTYPVLALNEQVSGTYSGGEFMPDDLHLPSRELLYINAQFTGKRMRIYINTDLVADLDFGGEERIVRSFSSDLFIGGQGGEFRGIIESIRISRGIVEPILRPFTVTPDTVGLWDFEDEDYVPDLYFFNNRNPVHLHSGKDGTGRVDDGLMPIPMVCLGYDFVNVSNVAGATAPTTDPITAPAGYSYGFVRIRDFSDSVVSGLIERPSAYELLASYLLNIPVEDLKKQTWWETGILDFTTQITQTEYVSGGRIPVSPLNAVINASGTHPLTGNRRTQYTTDTNGNVAGGFNLDPMANPIERVRIIAIDFKGGLAGSHGIGPDYLFNPAYPAGTVAGGYVNRPPCLVVQSIHLTSDVAVADAENTPLTQGFLFSHSDDTPIWFTLGNGDVIIDPGAPEGGGKIFRARGQMTRMRFTQGQRFSDLTKRRNDAYFIAPKSRMSDDMWVASMPNSLSFPEEPPFLDDVALWLDSNDRSTLLRDDGTAVVGTDEYVHWWKNKAPSTQLAGVDNYAFFAWGDGWKWKEVCANARGRSGLLAASPSLYNPVGPSVYPGGNPTIAGTVTTPDYPVGQFYWGGSGWVNGKSEYKVAGVSGMGPIPVFTDSAHTSILYAGGPSMTDGDWSFYFVMTPTYDGSNVISLLHSELNDNINININPVSSMQITGMGSAFTFPSATQPDAGYPAIISIRIDESTAILKWIMNAGNHEYSYETTSGVFLSTNPLVFDQTTAILAGMDLLSKVRASGGATNALTELAPPGFIIHEVLIYPKILTDVEDLNVRQWFEDKYGVDV